MTSLQATGRALCLRLFRMSTSPSPRRPTLISPRPTRSQAMTPPKIMSIRCRRPLLHMHPELLRRQSHHLSHPRISLRHLGPRFRPPLPHRVMKTAGIGATPSTRLPRWDPSLNLLLISPCHHYRVIYPRTVNVMSLLPRHQWPRPPGLNHQSCRARPTSRLRQYLLHSQRPGRTRRLSSTLAHHQVLPPRQSTKALPTVRSRFPHPMTARSPRVKTGRRIPRTDLSKPPHPLLCQTQGSPEYTSVATIWTRIILQRVGMPVPPAQRRKAP